MCKDVRCSVYNGVAFRLGSVKMNLIWSRLRWKRKNLLGFFDLVILFLIITMIWQLMNRGVFRVQSLIWMNECICLHYLCTANHSINITYRVNAVFLFPYRELLTTTLDFTYHPVRVVFTVDWAANWNNGYFRLYCLKGLVQ